MRLFRAPTWCPSGGGGTREAGSTVAESMVALYRVNTHQIRRGQLDRRRARGVLNPCAQTGRFLREKLISDDGLVQGPTRSGERARGFSRDAQGFGRLYAGSRAGFSSRPPPPWTSAFQFSLFLHNVWP